MVVPEWSAATVIHAVYDAWADGDADTFVKLYTDDGSEACISGPERHRAGVSCRTIRSSLLTSGETPEPQAARLAAGESRGRHC
jgi:hypothetical protein